MIASICAPAPDFNPRSYKRSDHFLPKRLQDIYNFNPRSYKRSDLITNKQACAVSDFNPRSYKRSDFITGAFSHDYKDFNPRSYKRSDLSDLPPFAPPDISIHAPTRGATPSVPIDVSICSISIHAPTRGATIHSVMFYSKNTFQSTLLQEERQDHRLRSFCRK